MLPWPVLKIPEYHSSTLGQWSVHRYENLPQMGYFEDRQGAGDVYALLKNGQSWMSTAWDEIESQAPHVAASRGHVVVMGAGMGIVVHNMLLKPEVERITLVEHDPFVIELLYQITDVDNWPCIEKLNIEVCNAFDYRSSKFVDHLYVDIWADPGNPEAILHTQQIQKNVHAETVGWWTQEIEFLRWLETKLAGSSPSLERYAQWVDEINLPLIEQGSSAYLECITQVAHSYCYRMVVQRLLQPVNSSEDSLNTDSLIVNEHIQLRPVKVEDGDFLFQVYASTRSDEMVLVPWSDDQKWFFLHMQFDAQAKHYSTYFPDAEYSIVERKDGTSVGRLIVDRSGDFILLMDIALLPEFRRFGIGTKILQDLIAEAIAKKQSIVLHVEAFNPAMRLYERFGFVKRTEQGIYYEMVWHNQTEK